MKKRKKKIYNTVKKNSHKNKVNSLIEFIKSFNNERCNICDSIIANHANRFYCGKCHLNI